MNIYTKKGDGGETCLFGNKKTSKSSSTINAIGVVDELNSYLGVVISVSEDSQLKRILREVQKDLLIVGSILAGSNLRFFKSKTEKLEKLINEIEKKLPPLKRFILPGGSKVASSLHFARSLARRVERSVVALSVQTGLNGEKKVKPQILTYLNRLSDLLFMMAREANRELGVEEERWEKKG